MEMRKKKFNFCQGQRFFKTAQ